MEFKVLTTDCWCQKRILKIRLGSTINDDLGNYSTFAVMVVFQRLQSCSKTSIKTTVCASFRTTPQTKQYAAGRRW